MDVKHQAHLSALNKFKLIIGPQRATYCFQDTPNSGQENGLPTNNEACFLLNGTLTNEAVFLYERLILQFNVCTQQASLSSKNALVQFLQLIAMLAVTQKNTNRLNILPPLPSTA